MLLVSEVFLHSKMPDYLATILTARAGRASGAMLLLCLFTGFLSIALENVAVVLLVAPIALSITRRCDLDPVPLFVGLAVSSNLQGAVTLIGDPPSMLLAGHAGLSFNDFLVFDARPGIFFAVQLGAAASALVLWRSFRRYDGPMPDIPRERFVSLTPTVLVLLLVAALVVASSWQLGVAVLPGLLCCLFGLVSFAWHAISRRARGLGELIRNLDWQTGLFLAGIFVLVESLAAVGLLEDVARLIATVRRCGAASPLCDNEPAQVLRVPLDDAQKPLERLQGRQPPHRLQGGHGIGPMVGVGAPYCRKPGPQRIVAANPEGKPTLEGIYSVLQQVEEQAGGDCRVGFSPAARSLLQGNAGALCPGLQEPCTSLVAPQQVQSAPGGQVQAVRLERRRVRDGEPRRPLAAMAGDQHPGQHPAAGQVQGQSVPVAQMTELPASQDPQQGAQPLELSLAGVMTGDEEVLHSVRNVHGGGPSNRAEQRADQAVPVRLPQRGKTHVEALTAAAEPQYLRLNRETLASVLETQLDGIAGVEAPLGVGQAGAVTAQIHEGGRQERAFRA